ncbi:hypothetical protein D3C73_688100 [compost metagenome]
MAVVVAVHRVMHDAGRHELRHADGARIRSPRFEFQLVFHDQRQEVRQLAPEHRGAFGFVGIRVIEGQRGQRIQYPEIAHVAAV